MKKSQLRNIIRESIKGLMTEQSVQPCYEVNIRGCGNHPTLGGGTYGTGGTFAQTYARRTDNAPIQVGDILEGTLPTGTACNAYGEIGRRFFVMESTLAQTIITTGPNGPGTWSPCEMECPGTNMGVGSLTIVGDSVPGGAGECPNGCLFPSGMGWGSSYNPSGPSGQATIGCPNLDTGCTDSTACNYDSNATINDGSCEFTSCAGCTDSNAFNHDPNATQDDGSCDYGWRCGQLPSGGAVAEQVSMPTGCMPGTSTDIGVFSSESFCLSQNTNIPNGCGGTSMGALVKPLDVEPKSADIKKADPQIDRMKNLANIKKQ